MDTNQRSVVLGWRRTWERSKRKVEEWVFTSVVVVQKKKYLEKMMVPRENFFSFCVVHVSNELKLTSISRYVHFIYMYNTSTNT